MTRPSARARRRRIAPANRVLLVLLLIVAALAAPAATRTARADDGQDPPALISVDDAKSAGLKAQIADYDQSVTAQQSAKQALAAEKTTIENQIAAVNQALDADDAAGAATDHEFADLNSAIQAYNDAGPPGDPAYAAELDAEGKQLADQQDQNNAKVRADNAEHERVTAALTEHNKKDADYENTNQKLTAERATLLEQVLAEQAAADLTVIATLSTVDSLSGMDSPQQDQAYVTNGGDTTAPATRPSCGHSFAAGTEVLTAAGTGEPIQDVRVGDLVENAQAGGGTEIHKVEQVHVTTTDTDFTTLTVRTAAGPETVTGTRNHPYYDRSVGTFVNAEDLRPGDRLQSTDAATPVTVLSVQSHTGHMVTYDLTISGLHTYFVEAGGTPVLVHNAACPLDNLLKMLPAKYDSGPTSGVGMDAQGNVTKVISSGGGTYKSLTALARSRLAARGFFANSARAVDAEQKFAASMLNPDGSTRIQSADFVINHPTGVCDVPLGCDMSIPYILNKGQTLTVHWLDGSGTWHSNVYQGED